VVFQQVAVTLSGMLRRNDGFGLRRNVLCAGSSWALRLRSGQTR
jgi:hypothetical protein